MTTRLITLIIRFGLIGIIAAMVHYATALLLFKMHVCSLVLANFFGFTLAFWVSYFGHFYFSFQTSAGHGQALPRFIITALCVFLFNDGCVMMLTRFSHLSASIILVLAIILAAGFSFLINRFFAFKAS